MTQRTPLARKYPTWFDARSVTLFTAMTVCGLAAQAQSTAGPAESIGPSSTASSAAAAAFERSDSNRDGRLSPAEAQALPAIAQQFKALDKNGDGFLSPGEFVAAGKG